MLQTNVCAWLTNFQPALVPLANDSTMEDEVASYFQSLQDSADSEASDVDDEVEES